MRIGEKIRYYRELAEMTQEELALAAGYKGRSSISRIEKGDAEPQQRKIVAIADALGVLPGMLLSDNKDTIDERENAAIILSDLTPEEFSRVVQFAAFVRAQRK